MQRQLHKWLPLLQRQSSSSSKSGGRGGGGKFEVRGDASPAPEGYPHPLALGIRARRGQKGDDQEDLELQLALHNSAVDHRVDPEEEEEALKQAIALSLEEAGGEP